MNEYIGFEDDPIFLLSEEEYEKYKDKIPPIIDKELYERYKRRTMSLCPMGFHEPFQLVKDSFAQRWWLRDPGTSPNYSSFVEGNNEVYSSGIEISRYYVDVRPAIHWQYIKPHITNWANEYISETDDTISIFEAFGHNWIVLDDNIAIAKESIGHEKFDGNSNDYATSSIRKWLQNWLDEQIKKSCKPKYCV